MIAHVISIGSPASGPANTSSSGAVHTDAVNTTGANLLVAVLSCFGATPSVTVSDSKSNTWTALTNYLGTDANVRIYYSVPSSVGTSHSFNAAQAGGATPFPSISVSAFSGAHATPYTSQVAGSGGTGTSRQPGSITPSEDNCLVISGVDFNTGTSPSINSSFTIGATSIYVSSYRLGGSIAYLIQTTATVVNPTWSWTGSVNNAASIAVFKSAAAIIKHPDMRSYPRGVGRGTRRGVA
jgi:hypothetical protein